MKRIHSECRTGIIYLGETADESNLVPEFLETLTQSIVKLNRRTKKPLKFDPENEHLFPEENHPGWRRLVALLNRPWFRRVWVIQEFALPPDIQLICGEWERPGTYLAALLSIPIWDYSYSVATALTSEQIHGAGIDTATTLDLHPLHLLIRHGQGRALSLGLDSFLQISSSKYDLGYRGSLVWLLRQTSICQATDPRDKIFAVISLASNATDSSLVADYSESIERVAVRFGVHFVRTGYGLSLLLSSACSNGVAAGLPSWLPDWTGPQQAVRFSVWPDCFDKCLDCQIGANPENQTITLCGYFVDTAQALGLPMGNEDWTDKWINSIDVLVQNSPAYPTGQSVDEAVWRTIIADRSIDGQSPAPEEYGTIYRTSREISESMELLLGDSSTMSRWDRWAAIRSIQQFETAVLRRSKFCITERGFFGMLPEQAEVGDRIFVVKGDQKKATFLLRWSPAVDQYRWIGHAYVHNDGKSLELDSLAESTVVVY
jgi:hypothetical protein